jgi:DNA-binding NarL/FixJ family response regulator
MKAEAMNHVAEAIRNVFQGKIYLSPAFGERLIFKAVQSTEAGTGSPADALSDRELGVLQQILAGLFEACGGADGVILKSDTVERNGLPLG